MTSPLPIDQAKRVTLIGAGVNLTLALLKLIIGKMSNSHALIADGVHSLSDLITDALVLVTAHYGYQEADSEHPYGHRRIETLGSVIIALVLILVAGGIMYDAIMHIITREELTAPGKIALAMATVSVIANEWLYRITQRTAKRLHSQVLTANAWHHRSDAGSSLVVVIALVGAALGWVWLDSLAAIVVALMIVHMGGKLAWSGVRELIDTSADYDVVLKIQKTIRQVPGVVATHQLRTRSLGGKIAVDVHVIVDTDISVSEGHHIGESVEQSLLNDIEHIMDVTVHIDPEDDECAPHCAHLPLRDEIVGQLKQQTQNTQYAKLADRYILHYLSGKILLEVGVPIAHCPTPQITEQYHTEWQTIIASFDDIAEVKPFYYS